MATDSDPAGGGRAAIVQRHEQAAAEVLPERTDLYVGGEWVTPEAGERFVTADPTTGEVLTEVGLGTAADIDRAVEAAVTAFEGRYGSSAPRHRQPVLEAMADAIEDNLDVLARLETLDNGKPLSEARIDMQTAVAHFRHFAGIAQTDTGKVMAESGRHGQVIREPYGVVGGIVPWNFPLLIASWKLTPAIAAGNCIVLKPARQTPLSILKLMELAGDEIPDGVVNVVPGAGSDAGERLTTHPEVRKVSFTGSTAVGRRVMENAAQTITDVTLELGGKSPIVVHEDADVETAVRTIAQAIFYNSGEACEAGSRLFVHESLAEAVLDGLVDAAEGMTVGDPLDEATDFGPKVSPDEVETTMAYIESAREAGGRFLTGGGRPDDEALAGGCFVLPTIIEGLDHDHEAVQEEIFGPVLDVFRWDDYDAMIELANDTEYGLAGGVITESQRRATETAKDIEAGYIWINTWHDLVPGLPFGGYKQSGIGRELSSETLDHYTRTKSINSSLR